MNIARTRFRPEIRQDDGKGHWKKCDLCDQNANGESNTNLEGCIHLFHRLRKRV